MEREEDLNRRVRRTRQALKTAFVDLILEKGYEAVTIMDIAERADYNRGTFYKHFVSKEDLLRDIHDDFLRNVSEVLLLPYEGMEKIEATGIYPSTLQLFQHIEQHKRDYLALSSAQRGKTSVELYDTLRRSMREDMHIEMEDNSPPLDYEILLSYQLSATVGVIDYWAKTGFKYSAEYMAGQLMALVNSRMDHIVFKRN
ncbi:MULTISPECIES: TetR/AcrR family transcriptional regulator [unclassified Paenibacillus]|uniref:TetR/AcrR family transcriptional regulator n=1 Tax=unclassified Paenibacillus TaxID=185978 RepID=UPI002405DBCD|nr:MULTISPECIES: TetR/AcrR family transcriptional regulator [unclassified Paenibacillus]MDF9845429.1 AcrR family transcriptional regulator [Paenibacillus sp. PastF-2]MDF9852013.1 AcrR family transcriptional regulator [Paenibacillus sp. PastM-2]MDF9858576.1 AcrR family transcriptional regulator [Paenibacillus sp. PastF-1]MDH6483854.1 AcrR family transcriptional regulator [Paenibacillus sp. PastH-2]MDH6511235.1 AcrR family transcriptional regulator [Paenibacillus sp. PastM-3]